MKNKKLFNAIVKISLLSMVLAMSFQVAPVNALTVLSDVMTRLKISENANHAITFTTANAVAATQTIKIRFDAAGDAFDLTSLVFADVSVTGMTLVANVGACAAGLDEVYPTFDSGAPDENITFTVCAGDTVAAGVKTVTLTNNHVTNPAVAGTYRLTVSTTAAVPETADIAVSIVDSDQVTITATIDPSLTFDLDTAVTDTESAAPYTVAMGSLTIGGVKGSNGTSVNSIWVDLSTNATGGAVVTVKDVGSGAAAGLYSAAVSKNIASATATLTGAAEGYGVCVKSATATLGSFAAVAPYNTSPNCIYAGTHDVGGLSLTAANILNSAGAPLNAGRAEILVKAAAISTTPAAVDYQDTLTFIATGTF